MISKLNVIFENFNLILAFLLGFIIASIIIYTYLHIVGYGGILFVDRSYTRPDIYVELDNRFTSAADLAKHKITILKIRSIRSRDTLVQSTPRDIHGV